MSFQVPICREQKRSHIVFVWYFFFTHDVGDGAPDTAPGLDTTRPSWTVHCDGTISLGKPPFLVFSNVVSRKAMFKGVLCAIKPLPK